MSENTNIPSSLPPAGWYPDPHNPAAQRYWDGAQWLEHDVSPTAAATQQAGAAAFAAPGRAARPQRGASSPGAAVGAGGVVAASGKRGFPHLRWWQWALVALGVVVLIGMISGALGGSRTADNDAAGDDSVAVSTPTSEPVEEEADTTVAVPDVVGKPISEARTLIEAAGFTLTAGEGSGEDWLVISQGPVGGQKAEPGTAVSVIAEAPKPVYTLEQQNALGAARSYLDVMPFSRQGLIDQLSSQYGSGYPVDVATWAADTIGADWNAEAVEAAQSYLDTMSFSRQGLYDQLTSAYGSQFTPEQANHALAAVGY